MLGICCGNWVVLGNNGDDAMNVSYVLKTLSGSPVLAFDSLLRAKECMAERKKKGITLKLVKVTVCEEEI